MNLSSLSSCRFIAPGKFRASQNYYCFGHCPQFTSNFDILSFGWWMVIDSFIRLVLSPFKSISNLIKIILKYNNANLLHSSECALYWCSWRTIVLLNRNLFIWRVLISYLIHVRRTYDVRHFSEYSSFENSLELSTIQ